MPTEKIQNAQVRTISFRVPESLYLKWKIKLLQNNLTSQDILNKLLEEYTKS